MTAKGWSPSRLASCCTEGAEGLTNFLHLRSVFASEQSAASLDIAVSLMHAAVAPADSQSSPCSCPIRCGEAGIKAQHAGGSSRENSASLVGQWQCLPSQSQRTLMSTWLAMTQTTTLSQGSRHLPSGSASAQLQLRKLRAGEAVHGCCLPPQPRGGSNRAKRPR